jgi:ParB family transcriptional regulator, chromosome partitioning protein
MTVTEESRSTSTFVDVPLSAVRPNPDQPRRYFDETKLAELAASIRASGLLQPLAVRPDPDGVTDYLLIAGERRWRACGLAGLSSVPVRILDGLASIDAYVLAVAENVSREDMTVLEEAKAYAALVSAGKSNEDVAALFGKRPDDIRWRMELLRLRDDVQELVDKGAIKPSLAWYLSKLSPAGQQVLAARYCQGRFRSDTEAIAVAKEMEAAEAEIPMFEVQEWTPAEKPERRERPTPVALAVDAVDALITELEKVAAAETEALVDVARLGEALDRLKRATEKARRTVRKAEARALLREVR